MRSLFFGLVLLAFAAIGVSSCSAPKELVYRDFQHFTIEKVGFATSFVKMDLVYYNPNNFGLQLKSTDLDVYVDSVYVGHTTQEYQVAVPRLSEFSIPLNVEVDMRNLLKNSFNSLFSRQVWVCVTGTVKVGKASVYKTFPVQYGAWQTMALF